jgi:hypothetical protein
VNTQNFAATTRYATPARKALPGDSVAVMVIHFGDGASVKSFVAGVLLADHVGPVIASMAMATASVGLGGRLLAMAYTLLATGIPATFLIISIRSERAQTKLTDSTSWVLQHRRMLASWIGLVLGTLLVADGTIGLLLL